MKIALIGATGYVGSALFTELLDRKYQVKALVLDPSSIKAGDNLEIIQIDVMHEDSLVSVLEDVDMDSYKIDTRDEGTKITLDDVKVD